MAIRIFLCFYIFILLTGCNKKVETFASEINYIPSFKGSYKSFNDKPDLHMEAAMRKGIVPMQSRSDTLKYLDKMERIPPELDIYKVDELKHSVPFLVDDAARLLADIGFGFRDSLVKKNMPSYKIIVTSITRTQDDVNILTKRNRNASENSVHCYGTTFDISWKRFEKAGSEKEGEVNPERLKLVLAEVLHDLRERGRCYIVHERKQACFHITVR